MRDAHVAVMERRMLRVEERAPTGERDGRELDRDVREFPMTDAGNGDLIVALHGSELRFDHQHGRWHVWRGHSWAPDADGRAYRLAKSAARWRFAHAHALPDDEAAARVRTAQMAWARRSESRYRIGAALEAAARLHPIALAGDEWNADPWLLAAANGVVDLRSGELRPGRPEDLIGFHSPVAYDAGARCPRWERFLEEIFEGDADSVGFMQRAMGYSLTGLTGEQAWFLLYGVGANGKTVLLEVLEEVLGGYAMSLPFSSFETWRADRVPNDLAALAGRRVAVASGGSQRTRLAAERIQRVTGEGRVAARFMRQEFFEFRPTCKLWLATNRQPEVDDTSEGFWRRCVLIPLRRSFRGAEADPELADALVAERAGVLAWAVRGCRAWRESGLARSERIVAATAEYRADSDQVSAFVDDTLLLGEEHRAAASMVYWAYGKWCAARGISERLSQTRFGREMGARFRREKDPENGRKVYLGMGVPMDCPFARDWS